MSYTMDHEKLKQFLYNVKEDLDFIVVRFCPNFVPDEISEDLYKSIVMAWKDLVEIRFVEVVKSIDEIHEERLQEVGLFGAQLDFKIHIYNSLREKFDRLKRFKTRLPLGFLKKRFFKIIDSVLESLSILIPAVHAITEFKDALDSALPEKYL